MVMKNRKQGDDPLPQTCPKDAVRRNRLYFNELPIFRLDKQRLFR